MTETIHAIGELHGLIQFFLILLVGCVIRLTFRFLMVSIRGWPPEHLDADGDFRSKDKDDEDA